MSNVQAIQRHLGVPDNGDPTDPATLRAIGVKLGLGIPAQGRLVRADFLRLIQGMVGVHVDGQWGPNTQGAVMRHIGMVPVPVVAPNDSDIPWLFAARRDYGLKEIPGPKHSPRIGEMLAKIGAWWRDDETPWCGVAMGAWMIEAGFKAPDAAYRAKAWATWGKGVVPQLGAIGVMDRKGGGHVCILTGETPTHYWCLGANQRNQVNETLLPKASFIAFRWPAGQPVRNIRLPRVDAKGQPVGGTLA